jgi:uncharacterized protein (DUF1330 family)
MMMTRSDVDEQKTYVFALVYIKPDKEQLFKAYQEEAGPLIRKHGGRMERVIKPVTLMRGQMELPDEIHVASFDSTDGFRAFGEDPEVHKILPMRGEALNKLITIPAHLIKFPYQAGLDDDTFVVALVYLKTGFESRFKEYQDQACDLLPDLGIRFERMLVPFHMVGDGISMPSEIHVAHMNSPEAMQKMANDSRMKELFPIRDEALDNLIFIVGHSKNGRPR